MFNKHRSKRVLYVRILTPLLLAVFAVISILATTVFLPAKVANAASNTTINFQARLLTAGGGIVADGTYNVEFKLYNAATLQIGQTQSPQGSCTGDANCLWAETRTSTNRVTVKAGYLTVALGSVTAFPTTINWDQNLWLTMNIGGTTVSPTWDGEMSPRLAVTSVPYAFRAGELASLAGSNEATLQFASSFGQATNITLPDPGAASATVCYQSASACGFALGSGTAFLQGGNSFGAAANLGTNDANALNFRTNNATRLTLDTSGNLTFAQASTLSTSTGSLTVDANSTNTLTLDTTGAGIVSIANNATTLNLSTSNTAAAIHIGDGGTSTTQTITIGSVGGSSTTTVTGGSGNVTLTTGTTTGSINLTTNNAVSGVNVKSLANSNAALQVQNSVGADEFNVDASGDLDTSGYLNNSSGGIGQFGNSITSSETIGGTGWSLANSETATQAATTAPDGTVTASKIQNGGVSNGAVGATLTSSSTTNPYTFSFWAKAGNSSRISCGLYDNTAGTGVGTANTFTLTSSWQRYTCTATPATAGHVIVGYLYADSQSSSTSGNYNYVWGAQAVQASVAEPYVATFGTAVAANTGIVSEGTTITSTGLTFSGSSPTISASTSNTSLSVNSNGTGSLILGNNQASNIVQIGNTSGAYAQTINIGNTNTTAGSSSAIVLGSTIGGNITLQSAATIAIGNNSVAQTLNIGNTTGATALNLSVGTGNFSLSGVAGSTFTIGTGTTTGSIGIGAALTTGSVKIGSTSASGTTTTLQAGATNETLKTTGVTINTSTNSTTALVLQNSNSKNVITGDTSNGQLILGNSSTGGVNGTLVFDNTTNTNTVTLVTGVTSASYSLTLPTTAPSTSQCLQSGASIATQLTFGSCGSGGGSSINNATATQSANFNVQAATSGTVAGVLEANASGSGDILDLLNGSTVKVLTVGSTGNVLSEASTNSTTAFQVQNASGTNLLNINTTGGSINVNALSAPGTVTASLAPVAPVLTKTGTGTATYAYEVVGVDANGAKTISSPASTTSTSAPNTLATGGSAQESLNITSTGAASYQIYRTTDTAATAGTGSATLGLIGSTTSTGAGAFVDTGQNASQAVPASPGSLTNGTTYYFKVTALDSTGGQTTASTEVSKAASTTTSDAITLSWAPVTGARSYNVYYATSAGTEANYFTTATNSYTMSTTTGNTAGSVPTTNTAYNNTLSTSGNSQLTLGNTSGSASSAQLDVAGSVPSGPTGSISLASGSTPKNEFVLGNYAYVTAFDSSTLDIIDISNPANPVQVNGTGTTTNSGPRTIYVIGNYAYVAGDTANTLQVFNVSNPANPVSIASVSTGTGTNPLGLYVQGRYAYVTDDALSEMQIFDVSNPANPIMVNSFTLSATLANPDRVYVQGKFAYVAFNGSGTTGGFQIVDISNPASPVIDDTTVTASGAGPSGPTVQGNYLYFIDAQLGKLQIYNVSNPFNPVAVNGAGTTLAGVNPYALSIQGHYAYITEVPGAGQMQVMDISNPASPVSVGTVATGTSLSAWSDLKIQGRYAYVTTTNGSSTNTLQIFDLGGAYIQDLQGGSADFAGLEVDSNALINGDENIGGGLSVSGSSQLYGDLGVSGNLTVTGTAPTGAVASIATGSSPGSVAVSGSYAYVLNYSSNTMSVVDVADPNDVFVQGSIATDANPTNIYISGNYAYVPATGASGVDVFNIDDPTGPFLVGWLNTGSGPDTVYVSGNYAYVTDQGSGTTNSLEIYNLADLSWGTNPIGTIDVGAGSYPQAVSVEKGYAYVTNHGGSGMEVFDVSHPSLPVHVYSSTGFDSMGPLYIRGDFAYVADDIDNLLITVYIADPTAPSVVGSIGTAGTPGSVYVQGNDAYVAEYAGVDEMQTFNVGNPAAITLAGATAGNEADGIWVQGNYAYLADVDTGSLDIFNVGGAYIQQLQVGGMQTGTIEVDSNATIGGEETIAGGLSVSGSTLLSGSLGVDGQLSVNSSNPDTAVAAVNTGTGTNPGNTFVSGNYAYVVNDIAAGTLQIYNVSNPKSPVLAGSINTGAGSLPFGVYVSGNYAYVTDSGTNVLAIYNISNPSAPVLAGSVGTGTNSQPYNIYVSGNYAYVTDINTSVLAIYNISNPSAPVLAGSINTGTGTNPEGLYVSGAYVYVDDYSNDTVVDYNISNPANPVLASTVTVGGNPTTLYVADGYAYVAGTNYGTNTGFLDVINIANPASLADISSTGIGATGAADFPTGISISGNDAYIIGYAVNPNVDGFLDTYDISNPLTPSRVTTVDIGNYEQPDGLAIQGRYAFVADQGVTLWVYDLGSAYVQQLQAGTTETGTLQVNGDSNFNGSVNLQGGLSISQNIESSGNLGVAGGSTFQGTVVMSGGANILATPAAPTVTPTGTAGVKSYSYTITAINANGGETAASPAGSTTTGNATLTATNYNALSWTAVSGATGYKVYRTVAGGTSPTTTGLIGSSSTTTFNDVGTDGGGNTAPINNTTAQLTDLGSAVIQTTTNSATAFQVQNAQGIPIFLVDTTGQNATGAQVNYLSNPGFETGISTWAASGTSAVSLNTNKTDTYNGLQSLKIAGTAASAGALTTGFVSAPAAGAYTVSFYVLPSSAINANTYTITLTGSSSNGTCTPASQVLSTAGFMRLSCTTTAFVGTLTNLKITNSTTTLTSYIDAVQLSTSALGLQPYQEGAIQLRGVITNPLAIENNANSTNALTVYSAAGVQALNVDTLDGDVVIGSGSTGETTGQLFVLDTDSNAALGAGININSTTEVDGAMFYSLQSHSFVCGISGTWVSCVGGLRDSSTAISTANTTSNVNFSGSGNTYTVPANDCVAGRVYRITSYGTYTNGTTATTGTLKLAFGATTISTLATQTLALSTTRQWRLQVNITCISATLINAQGDWTWDSTATAGTTTEILNAGNIGQVASGTQAITIGALVSQTVGAPSISQQNLTIEALGP